MPTPTGTLAKHADPMIGEILGGRYLVERLLDRGGMGLVYLATEVARERHVVVKMLAQHWTEDADAVARFDREGESLARLEHPNIVELFDVGRAGEQAYIAMEYIDGEPLRRTLKRQGHTTLREFGPIAAQILSAVGYAHEHDIMLRDIKPSNIMLCERDGKANFVKLLDFGLAKLVGGDDVEITKAHVVGTAAYLSPEQIKGEAIDVRVDVYALGVLFFVMLTGKPPIAGDNDAAILYNHVHGTPRSLADELPEGHAIPDELIALVHQCLEKDPNRRPADGRALGEALFDCLPPELFELPDATPESRAVLRLYRESKLGIVPKTGSAEPDGDADDANSGEWTKPVLRKPEAGSSPDVRAGTWKTLTEAARAATAAKRTSAAKRGTSTRIGLPAVATVDAAEGARRPPPAKIDPRRRLRRTGPRKIIRSPDDGSGPRQAPAAGVDATLPVGSGHVGDKARGATRPDGSGYVRTEARPTPPQPPPPAVPVEPIAAAPSAPLMPSVAEPIGQPSMMAGDSIPIVLERSRTSKVGLLVVGFALLAAASAIGYAALRGPGSPASDPAQTEVDKTDSVADASVLSPSNDAADASDSGLAKVEISVPAGAQLHVDGEARAPGALELPVGRHRIEVRAPGHERWARDVELVAGGNSPIIVELVPVSGSGENVSVEARKGKKSLPRATREDAKPGSPTPSVPETPAPDESPPPKPPPAPKKSTSKSDDVFIGSKDAEDDGVFLPVGKNK